MSDLIPVLVHALLTAADNPVVRGLALAELKKLDAGAQSQVLKAVYEWAEAQVAA